MMTLFRKLVIGGDSGSREGAWLLVLVLVIAPFWTILLSEAAGKETAAASALLMIIGPAVLTLWAVAHGLQKAIDSKLFDK